MNQKLLLETQRLLSQLIAQRAELSIDQIKPDTNFEAYGIDSIMIVDLLEDMEKILGSLPSTLFFEFQNIKNISEYLINNKSAELLAHLDIKNSDLIQKINLEKTPEVEISANLSQIASEEAASDIAIIGISGQFPQAKNLYEFWQILKAGKDCIEIIPKERWGYEAIYNKDRTVSGSSYLKWGGFIEDYDKFDPLFFNISKLEAESLDPQERLFLQTVYHTLENSGYTKASLSNEKVGVYVGAMWGQYQLYGVDTASAGSSYASLANRVSYYFNFNGPSIALDTMCSSSLTTVHLACQDLLLGNITTAIAGGVNITTHPNKYIFLSKTGFAATDGRCKSFGIDGDGYVPGDGVGALMLKRLDKAISDGDFIHAVIKSSAINHGGKTNGYTVPNPVMQANLIQEAIEKSGVSAESMTYIEAHGTGTMLGDPIEIRGLTSAFSKFTKKTEFCSIGSVKSNIGHLESAAGFAGIAKVLMQMKYGLLVPSIHSDPLNPNIDFPKTPFKVQTSVAPWHSPEKDKEGRPLRIAGVSSFGAGGANGHVILSSYAQKIPLVNYTNCVVPLSAKSQSQLKSYAQSLLEYLEKELPEYAMAQYSALEEGRNKKTFSYPKNDEIYDAIATSLGINKAVIDDSDTFSDLDASHDDLGVMAQELSQSLVLDKAQLSMEIHLDETVGQFVQRMLSKIQITSQATSDLNSELLPVIENKVLDTYLPHLAWTYQVGREAMPQRTAFVVSSIEELKTQLRIFIQEPLENREKDKPKDKASAELVDISNISEEDMRLLYEKNRFKKLANLWVKGVNFNWASAKKSEDVLIKMPLPTYPFKKERCWVEVPAVIPQNPNDFHQNINSFAFPRPYSFIPRWEAISADSLKQQDSPENIFIVYTEEAMALKNSMHHQFSSKIVGEVLLGNEERFLGDNSWELDIHQEPINFFKDLLSKQEEIEEIVFLLHHETLLEMQVTQIAQIAQIDFAMDVTNKILFEFSKILSLLGAHGKIKIRLLTIGAFSTVKQEVNNPIGSLFHGIGQSIAREFPKLGISLLDLENTHLASIREEIIHYAQQIQYAYSYDLSFRFFGLCTVRQHVINHMQFEPFELTPTQSTKIVKNATYLIVGGMGTVGKLLSQYLSERYQANIILLGRRAPNDQIQQFIETLRKLGGSASYQSVDITDFQALALIFSSFSKEKINLNGVFHLGMTYEFSQLNQIKEEKFTEYLSPKTKGSFNLSVLTNHYFPHIDFLTFFSSAESFIGNVGWGVYSTGCLFQDNLGAYLNSTFMPGKVNVVNWGFWTGSDRGDEALLIKKGIRPISSHLGMQTIEAVISGDQRQVFALDVDELVLEKMGILGKENKENKKISVNSSIDNPVDQDMNKSIGSIGLTDSAEKIEFSDKEIKTFIQALIQITAEVLKIDPLEIKPNIDLSEVGVDSLIVINIHKAFEDKLGTLPGALLLENMNIASIAEFLLTDRPESVRTWLNADVLEESQTQKNQALEMSHENSKTDEVTLEEQANPSRSFGVIARIPLDNIREYLAGYGQAYREKTLQKSEISTVHELNPAEFSHFFVHLDSGTKVECFSIGKGQPLLLIPAVALTAPVWIEQFVRLSQYFQLIVIHAPGYGLSEKIKELNTQGVSAVYVSAMKKIIGNKQFSLVSSCFGGIASQYIAAHYPEKIHRFLMCGGFYNDDGLPDINPSELSIDEIFEMVKIVSLSLKADFENVIQNLDETTSQETVNLIEQARDLLLNSQCADPIVAMKYLNELIGLSTQPWLEKIQCETWCVTGTIDTVIQPKVSTQMSHIIQKSDLKLIPGAGHYPFMTHAEAFNQMIKEFF